MKLKKNTNSKKIMAIILSLIFALSGFSVVSAADIQNSVGRNAQIINSGATADEAKTGANKKININGSSTWGLKWKNDYTYTNKVTGNKETFYGNQNINYHTYNYIGSSTKYTCWCIQPFLCINNNGNYMLIGEGGNQDYWKELKDKKAIKSAIAQVMAYGKPKMKEKSSNNNEYYFAIQILSWEFIMGLRGATDFKTTWYSKSYLSFPTTEKLNNFKDAYTYILQCIDEDKTSMPDMYKTIEGSRNASKKLTIDYSTEGKKKYSNTVTISGITDKECKNVSYSIVNDDDKTPGNDKKLSLSIKKNKVTVTQDGNASKTLYELKQSGTTYYIKATKNISKFEKSDTNVVLQNTSKNSQTIAKSFKYDIDTPVRYYAIDAKKSTPVSPPEYGSLTINKSFKTKSGEPYDGELSGWVFSCTDSSTNKKYLLRTNEEGITDTINNIPVGHTIDIREYGKIMPRYYDEDEWSSIYTLNAADYVSGLDSNINVGTPQRYTLPTKTKSIKIESKEEYSLDWENSYAEPISINISKVVDDNSKLDGYYFYVFNRGSDNLINKPTIVGPTNKNGECPTLMCDNTKEGTLCIVELGFRKEGEVIYTVHPTLEEFESQNWRNKFEIPSKFDKQKGNSFLTGMDDAIPFTVSHNDLKNQYKNIVFSNTTSGYLKIHKTDSSTNANIKNAVYGLYNYIQPSTDTTDYSGGDSGSTSGDDEAGEDDESDGKEDNEDYTSDSTLVCTLTTDENGNATSPLIRTGKYILKELSVDKKHYVDTKEYEINITPGSNTLETAIVKELKDKPTTIIFYKTEKSGLSTNGGNVKGAHIKIYEKPSSGTINYNTAPVVTEFDTTTSTKKLEGIFETGKTYIAHETKTPSGYVTAADVQFTIPEEAPSQNQTVKLVDKTTLVDIYKKTEDGTTDLSGCTLQVKDSNNTVIDSWTTTKAPHRIEGKLVAGKTYTLLETKPAPGYTTAKSQTFKVNDTADVQNVVMKDDKTKIEIYKKNADETENISGCKLKLTDSNNNVLKTWTTTKNAYKIEGELVVGKTYTITETEPAAGYVTAQNISFTVQDTTEKQVVVMKDDKTKISIIKKNTDNTKNIANCQLVLKDSSSNVIDSWTTTREAHIIEGKLTVGKSYTIYETKPAPGYTTARSKTFTVRDTADTQEVVMNDDQTFIKVYKKNEDGSKMVGNCNLAIKDNKGNTITVWNSSSTSPQEIKGLLSVGETYTLVELNPGKGYTTAQSKDFTVLDTSEVQEITMNDSTTKVKFSKTDITGTKELAGCKLKLVDETDNNNIITTWTSTNEPHIIEGRLIVGHTYVLSETKPKDGYATAESIRITVQDTGEIQAAPIMKDDTIKVEFSKTDFVTGAEIEGCKLKVIDTTNDEVIDEWTSTNTSHKIEGVLVAGRKYIMRESYPADGYATAQDVEVTVQDTGDIQLVEMKDKPTQVLLSKRAITGTDELAGCELELKDEDEKIIDSWTSTNEAHLIKKLIVGKTYTLTEKRPVDGYVTANDVTFTVKDTGEVQQIEPMIDEPTKVQISKTDMTGNKELPDCDLQLLDKTDNNKEVDRWTTTNEPHYIEGKLVIGHTYELIELRPASGYTTAESVEFTVDDTNIIQKITMRDGNTEVQFSKTDLTGEKEIEGCTLVLTDETDNNKEIETWVTTNEPHIIKGKLIAGHTYVLTETNPAKGYVTASSIKYTVKDTTELQVVAPMKDDTTKVQISKTDISGDKEVPNCKLKLTDKLDNKEVDNWTSTDKPHYIEGKLIVGHTYILSIEFTVEDKGTIQKVQMKDDTIKVQISKTDINGEKEIPDCKLEVKDEEGNVVENWISKDKPHLIENRLIANRKYVLSERVPADGYSTANDIPFTVADTGEVQKITPMKDDTTKYKFSKTDITGEKEIENCKLELRDKTADTKVDSWTSTNEAHYIEGKLIVGHTYVLSESYPADGYTTAQDIEFKVTDDGDIHTITMKDDTTKVQISKVDITGDKELEGCKLELTDESTKAKVDEWISADEPHYIEGKLIVGHTYILKETSPADGYATAEDVKFTVKDNGNIQKFVMKDGKTNICLSKQDITSGKEVPGCNLVLTDKADNSIVEEWTSTTESHYIEGKLIAGHTYILTETNPAKGYVTAESIEFTVNDTISEQKHVMKDDITKVEFSKTSITGSKELKGCKLKITDENGKTIHSWISGDKPHMVNGMLEINKTYCLTETKPTDGYTTAESIKFTVSDTGKIQKVRMKDAPTTINIKKVAKHDNRILLGGAEFEVVDEKTNNVIYKFTTVKGKNTIIKGKLIVGRKYRFVETKAPKGYKLAESVTYTVKDTDKEQNVLITDKKIKIPVIKTGGTDKNEIYLPVLLIVLGLVLLSLGGILIFTRKKKFD